MNSPLRAISRPLKARLTVEDFLLLGEHGAFAANTRTELIEGEIWYVNSMYTRHGRMMTELAIEFGNALRNMSNALYPMVGVSTRIDDYSLPEPDLVISNYDGEGVVPLEAAALLVEVSDSTLDIDLGRKLRIYARAGIAEYWVIDLKAAKVIQMWSPEGEGYRERREVPLGKCVEAATIAGLAVPTIVI